MSDVTLQMSDLALQMSDGALQMSEDKSQRARVRMRDLGEAVRVHAVAFRCSKSNNNCLSTAKIIEQTPGFTNDAIDSEIRIQ